MESTFRNNLWVIYKCSSNYLVISVTIAILSIFLVYLCNDTRLFAKEKCCNRRLTLGRVAAVLVFNNLGFRAESDTFGSKHKRKSMSVAQRCLSREESSQADSLPLRSEGENEEEGEREAEPSLMSRIKTAKHQFIVEQMTANMTEEQLKEEKEVEKAQLEAIFKLLQGQQEKFQVASVDQLHDQLNLYR